jgi:hypothetical protein
MPRDISAARARTGDVVTAIMHIDSLLKQIHGAASEQPGSSGQEGRGNGQEGTSSEQAGQPGTEFVLSSLEDEQNLLDGICTLIYMFMTAFRKACQECGKDVLAEVIPRVVFQLRHMPKNVAPATVPSMAAMMTAAAMELSPNLWREQYGPWSPEELNAVVATAVMLAEEVNQAHNRDDAALRMIMDAIGRAEDDEPTA